MLAAIAVLGVMRVMAIEIRRLEPADMTVLDRLAEDVFDEPVRADRLADYLRSPGHFMVVALSDGLVVGQCAAVIHRHPDKATELYIDEVGVAPTFQRRRIATQMLDAMFAIGREAGCVEAWVGTEPGNMPARALYRQLRPKEEEIFVMYVVDL